MTLIERDIATQILLYRDEVISLEECIKGIKRGYPNN